MMNVYIARKEKSTYISASKALVPTVPTTITSVDYVPQRVSFQLKQLTVEAVVLQMVQG